MHSSDEKIGRSFVDLADIDDGYNIHVMYVIPADGVDKEYDLNSKISMLLYQIDKWFNSKTKDRLYTDGQNLKFDRKEKPSVISASARARSLAETKYFLFLDIFLKILSIFFCTFFLLSPST